MPYLMKIGDDMVTDKDVILAKKVQLARAAAQWEEQQDAPEWLDTAAWPQYMESGTRERLYRSHSDKELKDVLHAAAGRLGRLPNKRDVFCVYRFFIIRRYGNWPRSLVAAGLKAPRRQRRLANRQREQEYLRRQEGTPQAVVEEGRLCSN